MRTRTYVLRPSHLRPAHRAERVHSVENTSPGAPHHPLRRGILGALRVRTCTPAHSGEAPDQKLFDAHGVNHPKPHSRQMGGAKDPKPHSRQMGGVNHPKPQPRQMGGAKDPKPHSRQMGGLNHPKPQPLHIGGAKRPKKSPFEGGGAEHRGMLIPAALTLLLLFSLTGVGCLSAGKVAPIHYYFLDPPLKIDEVKPSTETLGIRPLTNAQPLDRRMAYRAEGSQIGYRGSEWADRPGDAASRALLDALVLSGAYRDVGMATEMSRPDLVLTGELRRFYENRTVSPPTAEVEIRLELRKARDNAAVWSQTLRVEKPLNGEDATALAAAMSEALGELLSTAVNAMTP